MSASEAREKVLQKLNEDQRELLLEVFKAGHYADIEDARMALQSIQNVMFDRLVNREKPVDLGFVRLYNLPLRPDWKLLVAPTRPRRLMCLVDKFERFKKYLMGGAALMMDEKIILRTIEAEPCRDWYRVTKLLEQHRLKLYGNQYVHEVLRAVRNAFPSAIRVWRSWHAQLESASGRVYEGRLIWTVGTVPRKALRLIKNSAGRIAGIRFGRARARQAREQHARRRDIEETVRLWELSHLRSAKKYVRARRRRGDYNKEFWRYLA